MKPKIKKPTDVILKWIVFFNLHDANKLASLYKSNAVNDQIPDSPIKGKKKIQIMFEETFYTFPDIFCVPHNILESGQWVAFEWSGWSTMMKPIRKNKATKKRAILRGSEFFKIENGKIALQHGYWDKHTLYKQLGIKIEN